MKITVLKERRQNETRVAATPETVKKMTALGFDVHVEKGAGVLASFTDEAYKAAGATLGATPEAASKNTDILLKVRHPLMKGDGKVDELGALKKGALLISSLAPFTNEAGIKAYGKNGITAISLEMIPRITRAQSMDILSSQANLGGYRAIIDAIYCYGGSFPMMMTAAGTVPPAKVLILGAGVAGLQAIATAKRLGAVVSAFDVRPAVKEQVESLGAKFVEVESDEAEAAETSGGYAKEMSADYKKRQAEKIAATVAASDIIVTTALIPGKPAPKLISAAMVKSMKAGSVIVDMAVEAGGNVDGSQPEKIVGTNGVKIIGYSNLPGRIAAEASTLYARNIYNLLVLLWDKEAKKLNVNLDDDILKGSVLTHGGSVTHPNFKKLGSAGGASKAPVKKAPAKKEAPTKTSKAKATPKKAPAAKTTKKKV
ncbi:MAG TPA: Re/Si-specific NAD(P)(+) transhydrogenase subunit alpha [Holosporales bacterium]|nr:Re/Si-specific NAD(P)(+) transhydrogenase subunit alpha [Holosporales bacterium]